MGQLLRNHVIEVLKQGGAAAPSIGTNDDSDLLLVLESWLGMAEGDDDDSPTMEDAAPYSDRFYQSLAALLVHTWSPEGQHNGGEGLLSKHANVFLEQHLPPDRISLCGSMNVVRVTRLLRHWMELNVQGPLSSSTSGIGDKRRKMPTVSHCLLFQSPPQTSQLVEALYQHVQDLPRLQSQMNMYCQSLMRPKSNMSGGQVFLDHTAVQSRLQVYAQAQQVTERLNQEWEDHLKGVEYVIQLWYQLGDATIRRHCRAQLGSVWSTFVQYNSYGSGGGGGTAKMENTSCAAIPLTLRLLVRILKGTAAATSKKPMLLEKSYHHLLHQHLIPLHRPNSLVLWRDQTSLLQLYHEPLVQCIAVLLRTQPDLIPTTFAALLGPSIWTKGGNTPKLVLLLHEMDTFLQLLPMSVGLGSNLQALVGTIGTCMASDHSRLAERALVFIKNTRFRKLIEDHFSQTMPTLLRRLVRRELPWNPTVRKMTYNVLKTFQDYNEVQFLNMCDAVFLPQSSPSAVAGRSIPRPSGVQAQSALPKNFSLKAAMNGWKPRTKSQGATSSSGTPSTGAKSGLPQSGPPLSVTGVAPWAQKHSTKQPTQHHTSSRKAPPLGITGVAPWAMKSGMSASKTQTKRPLSATTDEVAADTTLSGREKVLSFMKQIKPADQEGGASRWSKDQMAESPTILNDLKFHDLVFGHDLGEGAFGKVRYARHIDRSVTRSHWAEFAVKIISTEKILEEGYESSIQREVAVLRVLSHPGIARLVSSFRFREGVYLVLEYAGGGDLYSLLRKKGSLDVESTRFVIGEVIAALISIHEIGLVYGDLKPENIVITESGHVKLTDFGGCRPVTTKAKELIRSASQNLLRDLRDGGWKKEQLEELGAGDGAASFEDDVRVEGTTAYLPPEVVLGGIPTLAADAWATGCVLYQCLVGRPPILEEDESHTKRKIVQFDATSGMQGATSSLFGADMEVIGAEAHELISSLLQRETHERLKLHEAATHSFFTSVGIDVFSLYRQAAIELDAGGVAPVADAKWARRQFSSIWAPQPQAYDISSTKEEDNSGHDASTTNPIIEGDEATAFFNRPRNAALEGPGSSIPRRERLT